MKKFIPGVTILILLASCCQNKTDYAGFTQVDITAFKAIDFDDLINSTDLIPLEVTPESMLPADGRVWPSDSGFFFNGQSQEARDVFYFNESGGFENTIGTIGKGPGEFPSCNNLIVLGDTVAIYDNRKKFSFYLRDGSFAGVINLEGWPISAASIHPTNKDIFLCTAYGNSLIYRLNRQSLIPVDSFVQNNYEESKQNIKGNSFYPMSEGRLFYQTRFDPRLMVCEITDTLEPRYHIEAGMNLRRYDKNDPQATLYFIKHGLVSWSFRGILENRDWLYLFFRIDDWKNKSGTEFSHFVVRKSDHMVYRLPGHKKDMDYFDRAFRLDQTNRLYMTIVPDHMDEKDAWMEICRKQGIQFSLDQNTFVVIIDLDKLTDSL